MQQQHLSVSTDPRLVSQVKLRSSDQQLFEVEEEVAFQSLTVKNMSEGMF